MGFGRLKMGCRSYSHDKSAEQFYRSHIPLAIYQFFLLELLSSDWWLGGKNSSARWCPRMWFTELFLHYFRCWGLVYLHIDRSIHLTGKNIDWKYIWCSYCHWLGYFLYLNAFLLKCDNCFEGSLCVASGVELSRFGVPYGLANWNNFTGSRA